MKEESKPLISALRNQTNYQIIEAFSHDEVISKTREYLFRRNFPTVFYLLFNIAVVSMGVFLIYRGGSQLADKISFFGSGFLFAFLFLFPLHESVHYLAYKILGAKNVRIEYQWRKITAFCIADEFVLDSREFVFVALAPFILINALILIGCFYASENVSIFLAGALILHVGACSGDVGLTNLIWLFRSRTLWTFDDAKNRMSYFFQKKIIAEEIAEK